MASREVKIDHQAVSLLAEGDVSAFNQLYSIYAEKVYFFALNFLKSEVDAENLTQEVFVKVWETRHRLDPNSSFNAYIFTIARNSIFNTHRKKLNEIAYLNQLTDVSPHAESSTEKEFYFKELREQLDRCIDQLPPQQQKVIILSRKEGLSHKEISEKIGIAEKTIAAHIRLALKSLRKCLSLE